MCLSAGANTLSGEHSLWAEHTQQERSMGSRKVKRRRNGRAQRRREEERRRNRQEEAERLGSLAERQRHFGGPNLRFGCAAPAEACPAQRQRENLSGKSAKKRVSWGKVVCCLLPVERWWRSVNSVCVRAICYSRSLFCLIRSAALVKIKIKIKNEFLVLVL